MTKIMRTACKNKTVSITKVVNRILHKNISHVSNLSNHESRKYACALDHEWPNANWINGSSCEHACGSLVFFFEKRMSLRARRVTVPAKPWQRCPQGRQHTEMQLWDSFFSTVSAMPFWVSPAEFIWSPAIWRHNFLQEIQIRWDSIFMTKALIHEKPTCLFLMLGSHANMTKQRNVTKCHCLHFKISHT